MKKLVFYGDGFLSLPEGYGEQLLDLLVLRRPEAALQSFHPGEEKLTLDAALKGAPLHVLGKAPDVVFLGLGTADLLEGAAPEAMVATLEALLQLIQLKTRARVVFTPAFEAFLPDPAQRAAARDYNARLGALHGDRATLLDLNAEVEGFLEAHRRGAGEKRALHLAPLRLTSMGRVLLSTRAAESLPWENL